MYYVMESNKPMMQFPATVTPSLQLFQQHYHHIQLQPQPQYQMLQPVQFHPQPLPQQQPSNVYYVMNNGNMVPLVQQPQQQHHQPQLFNVVTPPAPTSTPPMVMIMQPQQYSSPPTPLMTNNNMYPQPLKSIVTVRRESSDSESPDLTPKGHTLTCYACRGVGHKATQCPVVARKQQQLFELPLHQTSTTTSIEKDDELILKCSVHGKWRTSKNMFFNNQIGQWQCSSHTECKNLL